MKKIAILITLIALVACSKPPNTFSFKGLGGDLTVSYTGPQDAGLEKEIVKQVTTLSRDLNYYSDKSITSKLNSLAHLTAAEVPDWYCKLLDAAAFFTRETGGKFDITYKSEGFLWDLHRNEVPNPDEVRKYLPLIGVDNLTVDCVKNTVAFKKEGVKLDFGAIAAGYAADETRRLLEKAGRRDFLINYTGELVVCGSKYGKPWTVGIRNPLQKDELIKTFETPLEGCTSMSTSGDYERYLEKNGKKFSHIIDPATGNPVEGAHSVTVIAPDCMTADALATALSVGWRDKEYIAKMKKRFDLKVFMLTGDDLQLFEY